MSSDAEVFIELLREERWDDAENMIFCNPGFIWEVRNANNTPIALWAVLSKENLRTLEYLLWAVKKCRPCRSQELCTEIFEVKNNSGIGPIQVILDAGNVECLDILFAEYPERKIEMEKSDADGNTPLHWLCRFSRKEMIYYFLANSSKGVALMRVADRIGRTPLTVATPGIKKIFTPEKLAEIGLEVEHARVAQIFSNELFFSSLIADIIRQDIETRITQLKK